MKFTTAATIATLLVGPVLSAPTDIKYGPPPGGWESIDYPKGTGENLEHYPAPPGGWESIKYPPGTGEDNGKGKGKDEPKKDEFTSRFHVVAVGSEVRNGTTPAPGPKEAKGLFYFGINSKTDTICWVHPQPLPKTLPRN